MSNSQKGFAPIIIILGIVLILGIAGGVYYFGKNTNTAVKNTTVTIPTLTSIPTATPKVDETANWKTYTNNELAYQFKYPGDWVVDTNKSKSSTTKHLVIGFVSSEQQGLMGITYCGAHAEDKSRCESFKINNSDVAAIDWGVNQDDGANVIISNPKGGAILFYLTPLSSENKKIFYQILTTFKFLDQQQTAVEGKDCGGFAGETGQMACPTGYYCKYPTPMYPDASGKCIKK